MDTELWNNLDLKPPPTLTCKLTSSEVSFSDLRKLSDIFWDAVTVLQNQQELYAEGATLSRLIYRMKNMFRGDKGFKSIEKVNRCLRLFLHLNLAPIFDNFFRSIPWNSSEKDIYCPTRQMLEHILVRTQGLAALLSRIVHTCLEAAFLIKHRMSSGHHWSVALLCLGVISRIWAIAKHLFSCCMRWYIGMLPFRMILKPQGQCWLPEAYTFPGDLSKWLDVPWMDTIVPGESKADVFTDNNKISDKKREIQPTSSTSQIKARIQLLSGDVGVSVPRNLLMAASGNSFENSKTHTHDDVGESKSRNSLAMPNDRSLGKQPLLDPSGSTQGLQRSAFNQKYDHKTDKDVTPQQGSKKKKKKKGKVSPPKTTSPCALNGDLEIISDEKSESCEGIKKTVKTKDKITQLKFTKKKALGTGLSQGSTSRDLESGKVESGNDVDCEIFTSFTGEVQEGNFVSFKTGQKCKDKNLVKVLSSIKSSSDVQTLLSNESKKRSLTSSLNNHQWSLLQSSVKRLNSKLQRVQDESKKQQIVKQIRKLFRTSLS